MSSDKPELSRAGTMQVTAKEGKVYLDKNLTEWKKPFLMEEEEGTTEKGKKTKMSKHTTMKGTAKEANEFLSQKGAPDEDVGTRGQQRKLDQIQAEKPASKKAKLARDSTMAATAKVAKTLLKGDKLGDTRQETKRKQPKGSNLKRLNTADAVLAEAKAVYGDLDTSEGRSLRKRPAPAPKPAPKPKKAKKPAMKKANTMKRTAQEGEEFLERDTKAE